jgi:hypothetical protein
MKLDARGVSWVTRAKDNFPYTVMRRLPVPASDRIRRGNPRADPIAAVAVWGLVVGVAAGGGPPAGGDGGGLLTLCCGTPFILFEGGSCGQLQGVCGGEDVPELALDGGVQFGPTGVGRAAAGGREGRAPWTCRRRAHQMNRRSQPLFILLPVISPSAFSRNFPMRQG